MSGELTKPRKSYGVLPTAKFMAFTLLTVVMIAAIAAQVFFAESTVSRLLLLVQIIGFTLFFSILMSSVAGGVLNLRALYFESKRLRYFRKHIRPHLYERYGAWVRFRTTQELIDLSWGRSTIIGIEGTAGVHDLRAIQRIAEGEDMALDPDSIFLYHDLGNGLLEEVSRIDDPTLDPQRLAPPEAPKPPLAEFETSVRSFVMRHVSLAKEGTGQFTLMSSGNRDEGMVSAVATFKFLRREEGLVEFSQKDLDTFIENVVFDVRMNGSAMLIAYRKPPVSTTTTSTGFIISENGMHSVDLTERRMVGNTGNITFVPTFEDL